MKRYIHVFSMSDPLRENNPLPGQALKVNQSWNRANVLAEESNTFTPKDLLSFKTGLNKPLCSPHSMGWVSIDGLVDYRHLT